MTNREWINSLSNEEFILYLIASCDVCAYAGRECIKHDGTNCYEGCMKWLEQEREGSENE